MNLTDAVLAGVATDYARSFERRMQEQWGFTLSRDLLDHEQEVYLKKNALDRESEAMKLLRLFAAGPRRYDKLGLSEDWFNGGYTQEVSEEVKTLFALLGKGWVSHSERRWFFLTEMGVGVAFLLGLVE